MKNTSYLLAVCEEWTAEKERQSCLDLRPPLSVVVILVLGGREIFLFFFLSSQAPHMLSLHILAFSIAESSSPQAVLWVCQSIAFLPPHCARKYRFCRPHTAIWGLDRVQRHRFSTTTRVPPYVSKWLCGLLYSNGVGGREWPPARWPRNALLAQARGASQRRTGQRFCGGNQAKVVQHYVIRTVRTAPWPSPV